MAKAAKADTAEAHDELDGINDRECCFDCMPDMCMITGDGHCGHPNKGGVQAHHMGKPDVMVRFNRARKMIRHQTVEKKD